MLSTEVRLPREGQEVTFTSEHQEGDLNYTTKHYGYYSNGKFYAFCGTDKQRPMYKEVKNVLNWKGIHSE